MNVKQLWLEKVSYSLQKILPGKILTFYNMYFYRFMKQTQQNLFLLKYRMAPSYDREIIYLYVFRIQFNCVEELLSCENLAMNFSVV